MAVKPKLALIPSGYKASKVYSVLPVNGVGDFDFSRSGDATRVNKDGLIETVASNVPRLNYPLIDGVVQGCPSLLLEPERRNLIQYSEDFSQSYWSKSRATITSNQIISPDGTLNADLLTVTDTPENYVQTNVSLSVSGTKQTISFFAKKGTNNFTHILLWDSSSNGCRQWFDLENGTVESSALFGSGISVDSASIENYGNGWFRCIVVFNCSLTSVRTRISASNGDGQTNGTIGKTIFIWGYQCEANSSYPTSYIPNYGTALGVTRSAETANGAGDASTFNDSEGVLFSEISALDEGGTSRRISVSHATANTDNRVTIEVDETARNIKAFMSSGGTTVGSLTAIVDSQTHNNKVALIYKENTFNIYVNGFLLDTDPSIASLPIGLSRLQFEGANGSNPFYGNTKQIQYFDTSLNDTELETLTSWTSFNEMATSQLYTIQ